MIRALEIYLRFAEVMLCTYIEHEYLQMKNNNIISAIVFLILVLQFYCSMLKEKYFNTTSTTDVAI